MLHPLLTDDTRNARPIHLVHADNHDAMIAGFAASQQRFLAETGFKPTAGKIAILPGAQGGIACVLFGIEALSHAAKDPFLAAKLTALLPNGDYFFASDWDNPTLATLAFVLAGYRFSKYRKAEVPAVRLVVPKGVDGLAVSHMAEAIAMGRDLINTPTSDMGPVALADAARTLARTFGATSHEIVGQALLDQNFPMIHAVGRAASEEPRLFDMTWGDPSHPKVTLVGKGVCFDTGGLDIKPDAAMLLMKKDMGGAATAMTAARMIMQSGLKVRLRLLLPIVENAISANAFRPGDVLASRKGLTVEIGNTDAEGRLVLADALALADEEAPDLLFDFATLTGAARVALGPELPPFYTDDTALAADIMTTGMAVNDPVWQLPLWSNYDSMLDSKIADINNTATGGMAGSITAALFLKRFVAKAKAHVHFDIYAWTISSKSGLPEGGNPHTARLIHALLAQKYGS